MSRTNEVRSLYTQHFGAEPEGVVFSPGRVNLIGDHTDYNGGFSLPMAIQLGTWTAFGRRDDHDVQAVSSYDPTPAVFALGSDTKVGGWGNYIQGTLRALDHSTGGLSLAVEGDLPVGGGLSSSASLEMATAWISMHMTNTAWDPRRAALAGQQAENEWVGANTGLMDQFSVVYGRKDHALLMDFTSLVVEQIALPDNAAFVILDGGGERILSTSDYGKRRATCEAAAAALGVASLRNVATDALHTIDLPQPMMQRVKHVVTENQRVLDTVTALGANDLPEVGRLMTASHISLRDDYEVAGAAQDAMVMAALEAPGVYGARMTGGGFAGMAVALVDANDLESFSLTVQSNYLDWTGREGTVTMASAGDATGPVPVNTHQGAPS